MNGEAEGSGAIPLMPGSQLWLEHARTPVHANELMVSLPEGAPTGHDDFFIPLSAPDGAPLGWMQFCYVTTIRGAAMFAVAGWRPADAPSPPEQAVWLSPRGPFQAAS